MKGAWENNCKIKLGGNKHIYMYTHTNKHGHEIFRAGLGECEGKTGDDVFGVQDPSCVGLLYLSCLSV